MNKWLRAAAWVALAALAAERSWAAYKWKSYVDTRSYYAGQSASYLFTPTGLKKDGHDLTRAELLDLVLAQVVHNSQQ